MKTIISNEDAKRLRMICEQNKIKLPNCKTYYDYHRAVRIWEKWHRPDIAELLDWLLKDLKESVYDGYWLDMSWIHHNKKWIADYRKHSTQKSYPENNFWNELIDALLELFIWTIENGYYKGIE